MDGRTSYREAHARRAVGEGPLLSVHAEGACPRTPGRGEDSPRGETSTIRRVRTPARGPFRKGNLSREAYLGTKLTLARGLGAEKSYVEWCEVAAGMLSGQDRAHEEYRST